MRNIKKIWRDNTMPPTNYIWMRTDINDELVGVYEWLNGQWHRIRFGGDSDYRNVYSKTEVDYLLQYTEQEILRKLIEGEYEIDDLIIDSELSLESAHAVQNKVITAELLNKVDKAEFDALVASLPDMTGIKCETTEYWNNAIGYIPGPGEIIIYSDYQTKEVDGQTINIPGIKIGSGNGYVQDLAFLNQDLADALYDHITNTTMHVTQAEKDYWNNKLNVDDNYEVVDESLIFNRN